MEEQILKIIISKTNLTSTSFEMYMDRPDVAKEITSMVMEFVEWMHDNTDDTRVENDKLWWVIPMESYNYIEDVFEYWFNNIKK
jgi:hypothetical protein